MSKGLVIAWLWVVWFLVLPILTLSPWVAPYGILEPLLFGIPSTLFWWLVLTFLLLVSLWLFVLLYWKEDEA